MLRISPESTSTRIVDSERFEVRPGGSEANVAVALSNLGEQAAFVSCLPANQLGDKVIRELRTENVRTDYIIRNSDRIGLYWTETGLGPRNSVVLYDRENSGFSKLRFEDFTWSEILNQSDWFHFSGISPAVSKNICNLLDTIIENFTITYSVDLNFREKLWNWVDKDPVRISDLMKKLCRNALLITGNETDFQNNFGFYGKSGDKNLYYNEIAQQCFEVFPELKYIAISNRHSVSATSNSWSGYLFVRDNLIKTYRGMEYQLDCIADRVGTGDSFTAGIIYGLLNNKNENFQEILDFAVTLSALNHTVRGDASHFTPDDVLNTLKSSGSGRIIR